MRSRLAATQTKESTSPLTATLNGKKEKEVRNQEVRYNESGQPLYINDGNEFTRIYSSSGDLTHIIATKPEEPDFIMEGAEEEKPQQLVTDTALVHAVAEDGRPLKLVGADGLTITWAYEGCEKELITMIEADGDTIQEILNIYERGAIIESTWTPHEPKSGSQVTKYCDYKFNKHGHWVKRSYQRREGTIRESRKLTYY